MFTPQIPRVLKLWRPRITLRVFLVLFSAVSIWIGFSANRARKQRFATEGIQASGGSVAYDSELASLPNRKAVQNYVFREVERRSALYADSKLQTHKVEPQSSRDDVVVICATNVPRSKVAELIKHVNALPAVEILVLRRMNLDDEQLRMLKPNRNLRELVLDMNDVTDAGLTHLDGFPKLRSVSLLHNPITSVGLRHLVRMNQLEQLNVSVDGISDESVARLKQSLPNCHVFTLRLPGTKRSWWVTATEDDDPM